MWAWYDQLLRELEELYLFSHLGHWMGLQEHHQRQRGSLLPDHFSDAFVYVAIRLKADQLIQFMMKFKGRFGGCGTAGMPVC